MEIRVPKVKPLEEHLEYAEYKGKDSTSLFSSSVRNSQTSERKIINVRTHHVAFQRILWKW